MNEQPVIRPPEPPEEEWETTVRETARLFPYPQTPDLTAGVRRRLRGQNRRLSPIWRLAAIILLILLVAVAAVPEVRAVVLEFIQVGALRIFPVEPTATTLPRTPTSHSVYVPPGEPTPLASALDMPGETTLENARTQSGFAFGLPTYPVNLGAPDHVYLQNYRNKLVTLVWLMPDNQIRFTLEIFNEDLLATKMTSMEGSEHVRVNSRADSLWLPEPWMIAYYFEQEGFMIKRTAQGSILVWTDGVLTYRLESNLSKEEAIRIAESLE